MVRDRKIAVYEFNRYANKLISTYRCRKTEIIEREVELYNHWLNVCKEKDYIYSGYKELEARNAITKIRENKEYIQIKNELERATKIFTPNNDSIDEVVVRELEHA